MDKSPLGRGAVRTFLLSALVVGSIAIVGPSAPAQRATAADPQSGVAIGASDTATNGADRYIVEVDEPIADVVGRQEDLGVDVIHEWDDASSGFAAELTPSELDRLARDPAVTDIHPDEIITVDAVQNNPPWGLDRIDQRNPPLDGTYAYESTGAGVTAYVVDTGVRSTHVEFLGRIGAGAFIDFGDGRGVEDCNGHGTHVAGTLGGTTSGVAKAVTLVPVKVFDCGGSAFTSDVIAGLNWIVADHLAGAPAVVNMSLGTDTISAPLDAAVDSVIADGITVVAAAGNRSISTCNVSPARVADAITVAATNSDDTRASYSNFGSCNDLFAPGTSIVSAGISGDTSVATLSGTSMAAPHVAGAVARHLELEPTATPVQVRAAIDQATDPGVIGPSFGDPDKLLYTVPTPSVCVPPPSGIVGWWPGDGSPTAAVGPAFIGSTGYGAGYVGGGFSFDGTSWLAAPGVATVSTGLSFEAWVRPESGDRVQTIAARWDFPSTDDSARTFALTLQSGGRVVFDTDETSTRRPETLVATAPQLHDGQAHHIAATWNQTGFALFVDGVQIASKPSRGGTLNPASTVPVTLGGQVRGFAFDGVIDEPTLYSRALSAAEVASIHLAGSAGKCI